MVKTNTSDCVAVWKDEVIVLKLDIEATWKVVLDTRLGIELKVSDWVVVFITEVVDVDFAVVEDSADTVMVIGSNAALYNPILEHTVNAAMLGFPNKGLFDKSQCPANNAELSFTITSVI